MQGFKLCSADVEAINAAIAKGLDVRIHPDKYGIKITSEQVRVLRKPETPKYGFSDKRYD